MNVGVNQEKPFDVNIIVDDKVLMFGAFALTVWAVVSVKKKAK